MEHGVAGNPFNAQCHVEEDCVHTHEPVLIHDQPMVEILVVGHLIRQTAVTKDVVQVNKI